MVLQCIAMLWQSDSHNSSKHQIINTIRSHISLIQTFSKYNVMNVPQIIVMEYLALVQLSLSKFALRYLKITCTIFSNRNEQKPYQKMC